jgi:hypothetical protein
VLVVFFAGSMDRAEVAFGLSYEFQLWAYRAAVIVLPILVYVLAKRVCVELQKAEEVEHESLVASR